VNLLVKAQSVTPVAFRRGRDRRHEETLDYVAGPALLGALAAAHRLARPEELEQFGSLFLDGGFTCGDLYPSRFARHGAGRNTVQHARVPVRVIPRTARSCKRQPGFRYRAAEEGEERHGVVDSLFAWATFALGGDVGPLEQQSMCSVCDEPRDSLYGYCRWGGGRGEWGRAIVSRGFFTRTGISRQRGTAADRILYSREYLAAEQPFCGVWRVSDQLWPELESFLNDDCAGSVRIGHNRTRGLGQLDLEEGPQSFEDDTSVEVASRGRRLDEALRAHLGPAARHAFYLSLTLHSDCLWPSADGGYQLQIPPKELAQRGVPQPEPIYCSASARRVSGWNGLWGLPKADEFAITAGSVFLFGLSAEPDWSALAAWQASGFGVRRAEGFGTFRVADEFHLEGLDP